MKARKELKKLIAAALLAAFCVVLPIAFHAIPNAGSVISPMHIPVLICGLLCGWHYGAACGLLGVFLSHIITGMPPAAVLPAMLIECCVYGLVAGLLIKVIRTKWSYFNLYVALIGAMLAGRIVAGLAKALIFSAGEYSFAAFWTAYFVTSLPGIVLQILFIPSTVLALKKTYLREEK